LKSVHFVGLGFPVHGAKKKMIVTSIL
jgi:hypothetical protein